MPPSLFEFADVEGLLKLAEGEEPSTADRALGVGKVVGSGLLGFSGGTLLGYGAGRLAEKIHGGPLPAEYLAPIGGLAGAGLGAAYSLYKRREAEELERVLKNQRGQPPSGIPAK